MEYVVECTAPGLEQHTTRTPFLNLDDEDTPAFQTAPKNSQLFVKSRRRPGGTTITRCGTTPRATASMLVQSFQR
jgi:hypothetical protein